MTIVTPFFQNIVSSFIQTVTKTRKTNLKYVTLIVLEILAFNTEIGLID